MNHVPSDKDVAELIKQLDAEKIEIVLAYITKLQTPPLEDVD